MANHAFIHWQCLVLEVVLPQSGVTADRTSWRVKRLMVLVEIKTPSPGHMRLEFNQVLPVYYSYTVHYSPNTRTSISQPASLDPARVWSEALALFSLPMEPVYYVGRRPIPAQHRAEEPPSKLVDRVW